MQVPNWFEQGAQQLFEKHLTDYAGRPNLQLLQIGAYTGDASVWFLDQLLTHPTSNLTDVDTWEGSNEVAHHQLNWQVIWGIYRARIAGRQVTPYRMTSDQYFQIKNPNQRFDIIYVDGAHTAKQVAQDAHNADLALRLGGLLIFDDYTWRANPAGDNPADAIDPFIAVHSQRYTVVENSHQLWLRKKTERYLNGNPVPAMTAQQPVPISGTA